MFPYAVTLQKGMRKYKGHMFVAPSALYFICTGSSNALWGAVGSQLGLVGGVIKAVAEGGHGAAPQQITEPDLYNAVTQAPDSMIMVPGEIEKIHYTMWWRLIRWRGEKIGLPAGFPKPLRKELAGWTAHHGVATKGLK